MVTRVCCCEMTSNNQWHPCDKNTVLFPVQIVYSCSLIAEFHALAQNCAICVEIREYFKFCDPTMGDKKVPVEKTDSGFVSGMESDSSTKSTSSPVPSEPSSPGEAFKDLKLRKNCGEILLSRYLKVGKTLYSSTGNTIGAVNAKPSICFCVLYHLKPFPIQPLWHIPVCMNSVSPGDSPCHIYQYVLTVLPCWQPLWHIPVCMNSVSPVDSPCDIYPYVWTVFPLLTVLVTYTSMY